MSEYVFMLNRIKKLIINVPDFPKPGIMFKDITPLLQDQSELRNIIRSEARRIKNDGRNYTKIVAIESRGFIFGSLLAYETGLPLVLARKAGKLPREVVHQEYGLEYGKDRIEIHKCDISPGENILIVDDVLATGGTATAVGSIVEALEGNVAGFWFLMEIKELGGQDAISNEFDIDASDIDVVL
ncbi:adenine phosphoribosyltransferase [Amylibacter sp.]|nr:adenine phosphoribosyltransferase [Amylibacter sp.]